MEKKSHTLSHNISKIIACSFCNKLLIKSDQDLKCNNCDLTYSYNASGSLDLRLKKQKSAMFEFKLGDPTISEDEFSIEALKQKILPEVDFSGCKPPYHLTKEILSYFPKAKSTDSLMLDLGCGVGLHRSVCEFSGFEWVGLDYNSAKAPFIGDGHALPFISEAFEFVLSVAVLEHIRYPFVMMREIFRVLKPNGMFIGTVAFLEPFHGNSFYHHTHLGLINWLLHGGFEIKKISPHTNWPVLKAQAKMGLFPKMHGWMATSIVLPLQLLHLIWWRLGSLTSPKATEQRRIRNTTGAFTFIAMKI